MNMILLAVISAVLLAACGGGGSSLATGAGASPGSAPNPGSGSSSPPLSSSVSAVHSTNSSFNAAAAPRVNQLAYFQVSGSNLPATLALTVADCAGMSTISNGSTEARFQCTPGGTSGAKAVAVVNQPGGTTLHSSSITVADAAAPNNSDMPLPVPTYGFNLGNTFESTWGYPAPTQAVFTSAAKAGFNAIRIPCAWDFNSDPVTHKINAAYMAKVKQAVDWSIAAGMHVVINIHWDGGWLENHIGDSADPAIDAKLRTYWTQIATEFADYDNRLLFAAANEPNVTSPTQMKTLMAYYQTFVNAVRAAGGNNGKRWLVLQGGGDTSWFTTLPADPTAGRLMVEFHNYTPSLFTIIHDDQSWGKAIYFWGAAYHYAGNPTRNASFGEEGDIDAGFQQLKEQFVDKGIPVLVGEFQAAGKSGLTGEEKAYNNASTLYWNKYLVDSAHAHGLSPFYWSTPDSPFNYDAGAIINPAVVTVLTGGIAPPPPNGAPYAVTGVVATPGAGQVSLSWNAVAGATSYRLHRAAQSGGQPATASVTGINGTSYTDTGLNDGTTYYYQVVAVNSAGLSGFSTEAHARTPGVNPDPAKFNFETGVQRWSASGAHITGVAVSSAQHFAGKQSLAVNFNGAAAGTSSLDLGDAVLPAGATVTFRVWVPAGNQLTTIEPYLQDYNWAWSASWYGSLAPETWNTLTIKVPPGAITPLKRLGLKISTGAAWTGTLYVDSIDWSAP